jgi:hypothetical protein
MRANLREAAADTAGAVELMLTDREDGEAFVRETCAEYARCEMFSRWMLACTALADLLAYAGPELAGQVLASIRARGGWGGTADYSTE